jgi:hypothetical protein
MTKEYRSWYTDLVTCDFCGQQTHGRVYEDTRKVVLVQQETMKLKARIEELEAAISTTVEDLCLRAERASDSDVAQMLWGMAEDLENEKGLDQNRV